MRYLILLIALAACTPSPEVIQEVTEMNRSKDTKQCSDLGRGSGKALNDCLYDMHMARKQMCANLTDSNEHYAAKYIECMPLDSTQ